MNRCSKLNILTIKWVFRSVNGGGGGRRVTRAITWKNENWYRAVWYFIFFFFSYLQTKQKLYRQFQFKYLIRESFITMALSLDTAATKCHSKLVEWHNRVKLTWYQCAAIFSYHPGSGHLHNDDANDHLHASITTTNIKIFWNKWTGHLLMCLKTITWEHHC